MSIIVNGNVFRTLAEPLYVNGRHVIEAYANDIKVYPVDPLVGHYMKVRGKISRHVVNRYPYEEDAWDDNRVVWYPYTADYDYTFSFAALLEFPISYKARYGTQTFIVPPARITKGSSLYGIPNDPFTYCAPDWNLGDDGENFQLRLSARRPKSDYIYPATWYVTWNIPSRTNDIQYYTYYLGRDGGIGGSSQPSVDVRASFIFRIYISKPMYYQGLEWHDTWEPPDVNRGTVSAMQPINYPFFNGIYGPYYQDCHDPNGYDPYRDHDGNGRTVELDSNNTFHVAIPGRPTSPATLTDEPRKARLEGFTYGIVRASCLGYGQNFRGNNWKYVGPTRNVDQTFVKMYIPSSSPVGAGPAVCPITDVMYCGEYNLAPEWAKVLYESDLL